MTAMVDFFTTNHLIFALKSLLFPWLAKNHFFPRSQEKYYFRTLVLHLVKVPFTLRPPKGLTVGTH
jgi:hypothetical protein